MGAVYTVPCACDPSPGEAEVEGVGELQAGALRANPGCQFDSPGMN